MRHLGYALERARDWNIVDSFVCVVAWYGTNSLDKAPRCAT